MIIVDTNVILSALLTNGITRLVLTSHKNVFISPIHCYNELWKHRKIWNKKNYPEHTMKKMVDRIKRYVTPVEKRIYKDIISEAQKLITDKEDSPLIALALSVRNEGIWTYNTKHFKKKKLEKKIKILTIKDVIEMYPIKI